ncbi:MAG: two-component sensor histidine kinase, partial [Pseudomonadota bacterium]|nr:two-component sensor histidine kinase [Pseudomonadota bacterium]
MMFTWMKRYVPRGLYSRAALIMILPVVTLQLVVSVVFIQRHFAGVTEQMTRTTAREIVLLQHQPAAALPTLAEQLEITITQLSEAEAPQAHQRRWYDLTGIVVTSNFEQMLGNVRALLLPNDDDVDLILNGPDGPVRYSFDRRRVSATNAHQLFVNMLFFGGL